MSFKHISLTYILFLFLSEGSRTDLAVSENNKHKTTRLLICFFNSSNLLLINHHAIDVRIMYLCGCSGMQVVVESRWGQTVQTTQSSLLWGIRPHSPMCPLASSADPGHLTESWIHLHKGMCKQETGSFSHFACCLTLFTIQVYLQD